jgi:hypothetical protein
MSVGGDRVKASGTLWWVPTGQLAKADALIAAATAKQAQAAKATAKPATTAEEEQTPAAAPEAAGAPMAATPVDQGSSSGSPALWIVIAILVAALAAVGAYVVKLRRGGDPRRPAGEVW